MSESEIMSVLVYFHLGTFSNFKHYYLFFIRQHLAGNFLEALSYNRFIELMPHVFIGLCSFDRCSGTTFVDSTMIPVCENLRRYANKVFAGVAADEREWWDGDTASNCITSATTGAKSWPSTLQWPTSNRDRRVWSVLSKNLFGKKFADRGYIFKGIFEEMFDNGVHMSTDWSQTWKIGSC